MNVVDIGLLEREIKLAKKYLEQVDSTIAFTHNKNLMENVKFPRINKTQSWKSSILPTKPTKTTRGTIFRSQLSQISKAPIRLPILPQIRYQQICQQKTVHSSHEVGTLFEGLIVERINIPAGEQITKFNPKKALPPIHSYQPHKKQTARSYDRDKHDSRSNIKWNDMCNCMRCKLMKTDYEVGNDSRYDHWGQYPCVPDSIINREEQDSSDDEDDNAERLKPPKEELSSPTAKKITS